MIKCSPWPVQSIPIKSSSVFEYVKSNPDPLTDAYKCLINKINLLNPFSQAISAMALQTK